MKTMVVILLLAVSGIAKAETGYLKCVFNADSGAQLVAEGQFDGKAWDITSINGDEYGYSGIKAKVNSKGQTRFHLDTADEMGGDPDYTDVYDITVYGALQKGACVKAKLKGDHFSRDDGSPYTMKGQCTID